MSTVTVNSLIAAIRSDSDNETQTPSDHVVTDTDIVRYINEGYKHIWDALSEVAPMEYFGKEVALASPYTLPADFYRVYAVDYNGEDVRPFSWTQRNATYSISQPRYRVRASSLVFRPADFTAIVTLHYVAAAPTLAAGGSFDGFNGFADYIVAWGARQCRAKQDDDTKAADMNLGLIMTRIRRAASRVMEEGNVIIDVTSLPDDFYL